MTLTSLLNGAAQTTGNRIPPMFQSIGVIGIRKIRKQDTLRTVQCYQQAITERTLIARPKSTETKQGTENGGY